jgi:DNA-binding response OmpR family regulator
MRRAAGRPDAGKANVTVSAKPADRTARVSDEVIRIANLEIRPDELQLLADGHRVNLTVREFQTFMVLAERPDRVVTRPEIYARVWGGQMAYRDRSVDVFVRKVRRKLAESAPKWAYLHTHFGIGYRFTPERVAR